MAVAVRVFPLAILVLVGCALVPATTPGTSPIATSSVTPTPMSTTAVTPMPLATATATSTATFSPSPSPTREPSVPATIEPVLHELPYGLSEIPTGGGGETYVKEPESRSGSLDIGVPVEFRLDHCGLGSPVDIDGSLWDPKFGHDGHGAPIEGKDDVAAELIQENRVTFTLVESDVAEMTFQEGLVVTLWRHDGSRRYHPCM